MATMMTVEVTRTVRVTVSSPQGREECEARLRAFMGEPAFEGRLDGKFSTSARRHHVREDIGLEFEECSAAEARGADFPLED